MDYLRNVLLLFLKREKENLREITESRRRSWIGWLGDERCSEWPLGYVMLRGYIILV
nr:MAG TPA: GRIP domain [Caudoviricetes sp.]